MNKKHVYLAVLLLVAAILGGVISVSIYQQIGPSQQPVSEGYTQSPHMASYNVKNINVPSFDFTEIAGIITPAVVHIKTTIGNGGNSNGSSPFDFFDRYNMPKQGAGSGVIISKDGYIVTNNHVIHGASKVEVSLYNKRTYEAEVIGSDPSTDLAVVRINEKDLPFMKYGNSDNLNVGEWVLAVGNPFNLNSTITAGIVSAKARNINLLGGGANIESFIQTDAAVNPGNSGGALVNIKGELVGINTAIASRTGQYAGYSFAVPVNIAKKVVADIVQFGEVQRGFIGVSIVDVNQEIAEKNGLDRITGVYVMQTMENSAAEMSGIEPGDVILEVNEIVVNTVPELQEIIGRFRPGDRVELTVSRGGELDAIEVTLRDSDGNAGLLAEKSGLLNDYLGGVFENISDEDRAQFDLDGGVKLIALQSGKLRNVGLPEGFIITKINNSRIEDLDDLERVIDNLRGGVLIEGINPDGSKGYYGFGMEG